MWTNDVGLLAASALGDLSGLRLVMDVRTV